MKVQKYQQIKEQKKVSSSPQLNHMIGKWNQEVLILDYNLEGANLICLWNSIILSV